MVLFFGGFFFGILTVGLAESLAEIIGDHHDKHE